jgi:hypothetical protein
MPYRGQSKGIHRRRKGHMEACLVGLRSCGNRMTICQVSSVAWPEEMEATNLEANLDATEATVEWQELCEKEINIKNIESWEDQYVDRQLCGVTHGRRSGPKTVLCPGRSCPPTGDGRYIMPSLQCARDTCMRVQARTVP